MNKEEEKTNSENKEETNSNSRDSKFLVCLCA